MRGFIVNLREDGLFEALSADPARPAVRVMCDSSHPGSPWTAIVPDLEGAGWTGVASFHSLDDALDFAVAEATGLPVTSYEVRLPDGIRFSRPGRVGAEQVMASAGWLYVSSLIGFAMTTTPQGTTPFQARAAMRTRIEGTQAVLGDVCLSDEDEEGMHWCADLMLPFEGFVRMEDIEAEARAAFAAEGIEVIPHYDFRTRTSLRTAGASIIPFPADRIRSRQTAA